MPSVGTCQVSVCYVSCLPATASPSPDIDVIQVPWTTKHRAAQFETAVCQGLVFAGGLEIRCAQTIKVRIEPMLQLRLEL